MAPIPAHPDGDPLSGKGLAIESPVVSHPDPDPDPAPLPEPLGAGVYVHVPFCRVICPFCDFPTRPYRASEVPGYVAGVLEEARRRAGDATHDAGSGPWGSLFFGGGTPSRLPADAFRALATGLDATLEFHSAHERSLEANPEDLDSGRLDSWRASGVNRLSIGAQSLWDEELARLGRKHDAAAVESGVRRARQAGFDNLSVDVMYAFPGHTEERFERTLEGVLALEPDHVSAYAFTPEAGTPMGEAVRSGRLARPDEDREAGFYEQVRDTLAHAGFRHYEISNFARAGRETRHHLAYWRRRPYLGLGPGAVSFLGGLRRTAPRELSEWGKGAWAETDDARLHAVFETVFLGLRLDAGMRFLDLPGDVDEDTRELWRLAGRSLEARGLLVETREGFRVPQAERARTDSICLAWREEASRPPVRGRVH